MPAWQKLQDLLLRCGLLLPGPALVVQTPQNTGRRLSCKLALVLVASLQHHHRVSAGQLVLLCPHLKHTLPATLPALPADHV